MHALTKLMRMQHSLLHDSSQLYDHEMLHINKYIQIYINTYVHMLNETHIFTPHAYTYVHMYAIKIHVCVCMYVSKTDIQTFACDSMLPTRLPACKFMVLCVVGYADFNLCCRYCLRSWVGELYKSPTVSLRARFY